MANFCSKCGSPVNPNSKFCGKCGAVLKPTPVVEPVVEETATVVEEAAEKPVEEVAPVVEPVVEEAAPVVEEVTPVAEAVAEETAPVEEAKAADPVVEETVPVTETGAEETSNEQAPTEEASAGQPAEKQPADKKKLLKILIPIAAAVVVIVVVIIIIASAAKRKATYEEAQELYMYMNYQEAGDLFKSLGNYEDSAEMANKCYYQAAIDLYWNEEYQEALDLFNKIEGYKDSDDMAEKCEDGLAYQNAMELYEAQDEDSVKEALEIFEELEDYSDSWYMAIACQDRLQEIQNEKDYDAAMELYEAAGDDDKKLQEAADAFGAIEGYDAAIQMQAECEGIIIMHEAQELVDEEKWQEAYEKLKNYAAAKTTEYTELYDECYNNYKYNEGVTAYNEGRYEDAYNTLSELGDFKDSADLAASCIQDLPSSGEVYHNPAYSREAAKLVIDNSGFKNTYIKIYCGSDLVSSIFIRENESASIWLPANTYTMKQAYGDTWFGYDEMFGSEGKYWQCTFGGADTFTLQANYLYTISVDNTEGTGVGNTATDPSTF